MIMKKAVFSFVIAFLGILTLQSCNINSEIVYHKDLSSTTVMDIDVREFMKEMKAMTPDSLKDQKEFGEMDKFPTTWTSLYDMDKKEGKLKATDPDSVRIMKKIFMKSNKEGNEVAGFSLKMDHFNTQDYMALNNLNQEEKLPIDQNVFNNWDGKTLIINTENFNLKSLQAALASKNPEMETDDGSMGKIEGMMLMFFKNIGTTLRFENKIKSVTGKHDWFKQIDDHSVRIQYDLEALFDKDSARLKDADKEIVIVTE